MSVITLIDTAWTIFQVLIGINLVLPFLLFLAYSAKGKPALPPVSDSVQHDFAVIVTAYEQTALLPAVVASLLKMTYHNYLIYVVADKCDVSGLSFNDERVVLLRPETVLASNTRSHFYAIRHFARNHDILTIIDSDNLVEPDYLERLNGWFNRGFEAVQGVRQPKNLSGTYANLDAARDIYYHYYDGKLLFGLGSSATLAGSGMAFTVKLYRDCLEHNDVTGAGFDKVLQAAIVGRDLRIAFTEEAVVYDEKTSQSDQLVKQRARWINTWFRYFTYGFRLIGQGIGRLSWNQLLFGVILLRPPLFLFLLASLGCLFVDLWIDPMAALYWTAAFACFVAGFFIALGQSSTDARIYRSLTGIPKFIFFQVLSLLKVRNANKHSVATKHLVADESSSESNL